MTIPVDLVRRWQRQIDTSYADLSEKEKDFDRKEADNTLAILDEGKETLEQAEELSPGVEPDRAIPEETEKGSFDDRRELLQRAVEAKLGAYGELIKLSDAELKRLLRKATKGRIPAEKKLSGKDREDYERESELIRENKKKPEASKRHGFQAAKWTYPNGHPRCKVCGDEETMSGICNTPDELEEAVSEEFDRIHENGDLDAWDGDLTAARQKILSDDRWRKFRSKKNESVDSCEPDFIEKRHARDRCMSCKRAPEIEVIWADGRGRAWFCSDCYEKWGERSSVDRERTIDGAVGSSWGDPAPGTSRSVEKVVETRTITPADGRKLSGERKIEKFCRILKLQGVSLEDLPSALETVWEVKGFSFERDNPLMKEGEQRVALGVILEPEVTDGQGDIYSEGEVREAAEDYGGKLKLMHQKEIRGTKLLGHYVSRKAFVVNGENVKRGTWLGLLEFGDGKIWADVQDDELTGLSIGGTAVKEPA